MYILDEFRDITGSSDRFATTISVAGEYLHDDVNSNNADKALNVLSKKLEPLEDRTKYKVQVDDAEELARTLIDLEGIPTRNHQTKLFENAMSQSDINLDTAKDAYGVFTKYINNFEDEVSERILESVSDKVVEEEVFENERINYQDGSWTYSEPDQKGRIRG